MREGFLGKSRRGCLEDALRRLLAADLIRLLFPMILVSVRSSSFSILKKLANAWQKKSNVPLV